MIYCVNMLKIKFVNAILFLWKNRKKFAFTVPWKLLGERLSGTNALLYGHETYRERILVKCVQKYASGLSNVYGIYV